jgi:quercetin dioxygenase-like cupin family protein
MKQINATHQITYDGAKLNIYHANAGEGIPKHSHSYSHLTICHSGKCIIRKANRELIMDKTTQPVNLSPYEWHEIEALENETVFVNVFAEGKE